MNPSAQSQKDVDSIKKIICSRLSDSLKLERVDHFAQQILNEHPADAMYLGGKAIVFIDTLSAPLGLKKNLMAYFIMYVGDVAGKYYNDTSKMMKQYIKAEVRFKDAGNVFWRGNIHCSIGYMYYLHGDYGKGYQYVNESKALADSTGNKRLLKKVLWSLQDFSYLEGDFKKSLDYQEQILALSMELQDTIDVARSYHSLSNLNLILKNYGKANEYFVKSLQWLSFSRDSAEISKVYRDWGLNYADRGQPEKALQYLKQSASIAARQNLMWLKEVDYQSMSNEYDVLKNYRKALYYSRLSAALHDSGIQRSYSTSIGELEAQYKSKKQESEIQLLNKDKELDAKELKSKTQMQEFLIGGFLALILITILFFNRYQLKKKIEKQDAILLERTRISSDMHDELGSGISKIALLSEVMKKNVDGSQSQDNISKISASAYEALGKINEIVWSQNPKNDLLENMISYLRRYALEYLEPSGMECSVNVPKEIPHKTLSGEERRNIFLSYKEALHNIVKHAEATRVEILMVLQKQEFQIFIHDNGKGISFPSETFGNGLKNMEKRMNDAGGSFEIANHNGTSVKLSMPLS